MIHVNDADQFGLEQLTLRIVGDLVWFHALFSQGFGCDSTLSLQIFTLHIL